MPQESLCVLVSSLGKHMFKWFQQRSGFNLLCQSDLRPLPDWFELEPVVHVLDQQSAGKLDTDRIGLKALIDVQMRHSRHHLRMSKERPVPE